MIEQGLVDELRGALPMLAEEAQRPAGLEGVQRALKPWFATYPQPERTDADWALFWAAYVEVCGARPYEALAGAMKAWAADPASEFLPKPGKLSELAFQQLTPGYRRYSRAHAVLAAADRMNGELHVAAQMEADHVKPESQRERVGQMLASFRKQNGGARDYQARVLRRGWAFADAPDRSLPSIAGKPAPGSALTPEMLRLLGREIPVESISDEALAAHGDVSGESEFI